MGDTKAPKPKRITHFNKQSGVHSAANPKITTKPKINPVKKEGK